MEKSKKVEKCFKIIYDFVETNNFEETLRYALNRFLGNYLQNRRVPTDIEMTLKLKRLLELSGNNTQLALKLVEQSTEKGWASFYPINNYRKSVDNIPQSTDPAPIKHKRIILTDEIF